MTRAACDSAGSWSAYDTFFGGGLISSAVKHSRLDDAAQAAAHADRCLAVLRTELADVPDGPLTAELEVSGLTRFVDVWFDNFLTDFAVGRRIKQARQNAARSMQFVAGLRGALDERDDYAWARLAEIATERHTLLTG